MSNQGRSIYGPRPVAIEIHEIILIVLRPADDFEWTFDHKHVIIPTI